MSSLRPRSLLATPFREAPLLPGVGRTAEMRSANTWAKRSTNASNGCAECLGMPLAITDIDRWRNWGSPTDALGLGVVAQRSTGDRGTLAGCDSVLGTVKLFRQRSAWEYAAGLCRGRPCQTSEP